MSKSVHNEIHYAHAHRKCTWTVASHALVARCCAGAHLLEAKVDFFSDYLQVSK